jgi:antimicrobial peptide system SdpB family protein
MLTALEKLGALARTWARTTNPWTNVYGVARSILALSTALTLAFNRTTTLFIPGAGGLKPPFCDGLRGAGLFCVGSPDRLGIARWIAVALLLVVASGYRPRITGVIHWWISFSLQASALLLDGGDAAAAVLSLLLLPVTLTDPRVWHWQPCLEVAPTAGNDARRLASLVALTMVRVQVAGIYFHAAIGKFQVEEWTNGTALYYFATSPIFGATGLIRQAADAILIYAVPLTLVTWSVLVLEYLLSAALVMPKRFWNVMLWLGLALHAGIILLLGLVSFSLIMFAALILYLRPVERPFAVDGVANRVVGLLRRALAQRPMVRALRAPRIAAALRQGRAP